MPQEVRCVVFDPDDLRMAVAGFLASKGKNAHAPEMGSVGISLVGNAVHCDVEMRSSHGMTASRIQAEELLEAILMFCSDHRIRLPKQSAKGLELSAGNLVLVMISNLSDRKPVAARRATPEFGAEAKTDQE